MRIALALLLILLLPLSAAGADARPERYYQERLCAGMRLEVRLAPQRRADCVSATHAIEVDWHAGWKGGIGQALAYAAETGLTPGLILVCRGAQARCLAASLGARETFGRLGIRATLWDCLPDDAQLADCTRWELGR